MERYDKPIELIVHLSGQSFANVQDGLPEKLRNIGIEGARVIPDRSAAQTEGFRAIGTAPRRRMLIATKIRDTEMDPWDLAHESLAAFAPGTFVEPNMLQAFVVGRDHDLSGRSVRGVAATGGPQAKGHSLFWPPQANLVWHLNETHSQLLQAHSSVAEEDYLIRIGHFDTGYSRSLPMLPDSLKNNTLQRNFVDRETMENAEDRLNGGVLRQPGHGPATATLLAGSRVKLDTDAGVFENYIGGAPFAEVVCCRISKSVVLFKTSAFADALDYMTSLCNSGRPVHAVSMSMGGAPSRSWADAVNAAYMAGITVVTAAGNNFNGLPLPHVVYPARFGRVIAACGATYDDQPYLTHRLGEMQGNCGPLKHMGKALAAYTPNMPWADVKTGSIGFSGAGTSSATPQIAAAAAIYYRKHHAVLDAMVEPWRRVEAIRNALFTAAKPSGPLSEYFGNGILRANDALQIAPRSDLPMTAEATTPKFPILDTLFGMVADQDSSMKRDMLNVELAQLVYHHPDLAAMIDTAEGEMPSESDARWKRFADAAIALPHSSNKLRETLRAR